MHAGYDSEDDAGLGVSTRPWHRVSIAACRGRARSPPTPARDPDMGLLGGTPPSFT